MRVKKAEGKTILTAFFIYIKHHTSIFIYYLIFFSYDINISVYINHCDDFLLAD